LQLVQETLLQPNRKTRLDKLGASTVPGGHGADEIVEKLGESTGLKDVSLEGNDINDPAFGQISRASRLDLSLNKLGSNGEEYWRKC